MEREEKKRKKSYYNIRYLVLVSQPGRNPAGQGLTLFCGHAPCGIVTFLKASLFLSGDSFTSSSSADERFDVRSVQIFCGICT